MLSAEAGAAQGAGIELSAQPGDAQAAPCGSPKPHIPKLTRDVRADAQPLLPLRLQKPLQGEEGHSFLSPKLCQGPGRAVPCVLPQLQQCLPELGDTQPSSDECPSSSASSEMNPQQVPSRAEEAARLHPLLPRAGWLCLPQPGSQHMHSDRLIPASTAPPSS